jgi:hypothetical protein
LSGTLSVVQIENLSTINGLPYPEQFLTTTPANAYYWAYNNNNQQQINGSGNLTDGTWCVWPGTVYRCGAFQDPMNPTNRSVWESPISGFFQFILNITGGANSPGQNPTINIINNTTGTYQTLGMSLIPNGSFFNFTTPLYPAFPVSVTYNAFVSAGSYVQVLGGQQVTGNEGFYNVTAAELIITLLAVTN